MMKRYKTPINRTYHGVVLKIKKVIYISILLYIQKKKVYYI